MKEGGQALLGGLDCMVQRNFFGAQINSFETQLAAPACRRRSQAPPSPRLPSLQVEDELHHVSDSCCSKRCSSGPVVVSHGRLSTAKLR